MAITVQVSSVCSGDHGRIKVIAGANTFEAMISKAEITSPLEQQEFNDGVKLLLKFLKAASNSATWGAFLTKFTNMEITL